MDELLFYKAMLYYKDQALEHYKKVNTRADNGLMLTNAREMCLFETADDKVKTISAAFHYLKDYEKQAHL